MPWRTRCRDAKADYSRHPRAGTAGAAHGPPPQPGRRNRRPIGAHWTGQACRLCASTCRDTAAPVPHGSGLVFQVLNKSNSPVSMPAATSQRINAQKLLDLPQSISAGNPGNDAHAGRPTPIFRHPAQAGVTEHFDAESRPPSRNFAAPEPANPPLQMA